MSTGKFNVTEDKSQQLIQKLVLTLTMLVFIFSAYMNASFLGNIGTTLHAAIIFAAIGVFVELAKICAGMVVIGKFTVANSFKNVSIIVLCIFSIVSFMASTATISTNLNLGKKNAMHADETYQSLQSAIKRQKDIIENLLISQKLDIENGYRARAGKLLQTIRTEQQALRSLQDQEASFVHGARSAASHLSSIEDLICLESTKLESVLILILGALTEISGMFLLFLNFSFHKRNNQTESLNNGCAETRTTKDVSNGSLPIPQHQYQDLAAKIVSHRIKPTQRGVKAVVCVSNEKIAYIFKKLVDDGILERRGRRYCLCA